MDLLIEPPRSDSSRVKYVLVVGGPNNEDLVILFEAIHFSKQLVDCCSAGTVFLIEPPTLGQQRIDFVNKYDARFVLLCLSE